MQNQTNFTITLAAARVNKGLTQKQVAELMGLNRRTIMNWENGRTSPRIAELALLCNIYEVSPENIFLPITST